MHHPRRVRRAVAGLLALALAPATLIIGAGAAGAGSDYPDPGISDEEIVLGGIYPFSGSVSAFGAQGHGAAAFFEYMNETNGGIEFGDGLTRRVEFITYDTAYEPQRGVEEARRLVEQDEVFALFNVFGSPVAAAVAPYAHEEGVPMPFVSSSSDQWGDGERWPLATPFSIVGSTEGSVFGGWLLEENPDATVAILYQNDDFGKGTYEAFVRSVEGTTIEIVGDESFQTTDATVDSQITNLAATGADTFFMIATPKYAAQALTKIHELGWEPLRITQTSGSNIASVLEPVGLDIAEGLVSLGWYKEVTDEIWADDPAVIEFRENAEKYGADPNDPFAGSGWLVGQMAAALFATMETPTRDGLMEAMLDWDADGVGLMLPGIRLHTESPDDRYPMEGAYMMTFDGEHWVLGDEPVIVEGQTQPTPLS
ncbi:ABC transporter substrate-binding protein [Desertimonas flava]|uniref:ABC transporter substrate-binding protein n=1 Tax=Desertimonas flava TaxID=2064846 RepID=UPI000E35366A|nr:ABC transporter substrate-binding protein [Desertimonas flava]